MLYARSREVPVGGAAAVGGLVAVWGFARWVSDGRGDPRLAALAVAMAVAATAAGLGGQDVALDRTAAIRWAPRRAAHVLLIGVLAGTVLLALQTVAGEAMPAASAVRNSAGLAGLAALGAAAFGRQFAWTLPITWCSVAYFIPITPDLPVQAAAWMMTPPGTPAATWTALALTTTGTLTYALTGPRR
ncbi:hypothetical protein Misp01_62700 [Microtetraspora sp. NBRC 13810]|nr:hypothetical protein Misp01_62700 [Microtetraspora sp. NBRC 13810]